MSIADCDNYIAYCNIWQDAQYAFSGREGIAIQNEGKTADFPTLLHFIENISTKARLKLQTLGMTKERVSVNGKQLLAGRPHRAMKEPRSSNYFLQHRHPFLCHPERSRGICSFSRAFVETRNVIPPQICHLDRSAA
jgi:hypothetical protein